MLDSNQLAADNTIDQLNEHYDAVTARVAGRVQTRSGEQVSEDKLQFTAEDKLELAALDNAFEIRRAIDAGEIEPAPAVDGSDDGDAGRERQVQERARQLGQAITGARRQVETRQATQLMRDFDTGLRAGVPQRVLIGAEVFTRAATTATTGDTTEVSARSGRPAFIWSALGIPFFPASSNNVEGPTWQPLVSQTATAEGGTKPVMTDAELDSETLGAYAVTHTVSDRVVRFGVGSDAVAARLAAEAVYSSNGGIIDKFETHGTEIAFVTDAPTSLDTAIAEVVSRTGGATGIVLNAADYPAVAARSATSAGDVESGTVAGYNGLPLFMHPSMAAGSAVVVNGMWLSAHATDVLLASLPVLETNEVTLRAEVYAAVLIGDASAVQRVAVAA